MSNIITTNDKVATSKNNATSLEESEYEQNLKTIWNILDPNKSGNLQDFKALYPPAIVDVILENHDVDDWQKQSEIHQRDLKKFIKNNKSAEAVLNLLQEQQQPFDVNTMWHNYAKKLLLFAFLMILMYAISWAYSGLGTSRNLSFFDQTFKNCNESPKTSETCICGQGSKAVLGDRANCDEGTEKITANCNDLKGAGETCMCGLDKKVFCTRGNCDDKGKCTCWFLQEEGATCSCGDPMGDPELMKECTRASCKMGICSDTEEQQKAQDKSNFEPAGTDPSGSGSMVFV